MNSTIILISSSRRNGNTGKLADRIANELGVNVINLDEKKISPFDYDHRNRNDDFEPLMEDILEFDNLVFASPIYWYAVAPGMKIFLDRISDYLDLPDLLEKGRQLRGKTGFVISTSANDSPDKPFIDAFRETFSYLGMNFGGFIHANCCDGYKAGFHEVKIKSFTGLFINHIQMERTTRLR
jgi:multimeric flavodoxin WrbA